MSLSVGLAGVLLSFVLGVILGGISGYYGGTADVAIQRLIEFLIALPTIPVWMALAAALPPGWESVKIYFGITHHPVHRRLDRAGAGGAASYSSFARRTSSWPRAWPVPAKAASSPCTCCHRSSPKAPSAAEGFTAEEAGAQVTLGHTGRAREVSADA